MFCVICQHDVAECTCDDIDERLAKLGNSPRLAMKWCAKCDKHYGRCKCEEPEWYVKSGEEEHGE